MSDQPPASLPLAPGARATDIPLVPLASGAIPEQFEKNCDPASPAPVRMMAARAMAPIPPKILVPIIYQLMMDPDPKIAAAAEQSFRTLDDKLLAPVLIDPNVAPQILEALCHTLTDSFLRIERVLLHKETPDAGFVWVAERSLDDRVINVVIENQQRLLRDNNIVRGLKKNPKVLRSELDRAVDFLVREGVFLSDVPEFEDSFLRLGKNEMLHVLRKVKVTKEDLNAAQQATIEAKGFTPEQLLFDDRELTDEEVAGVAAGKIPDADLGGSLFSYRLPVQLKLAMTGSHARAIEALTSTNRMVACSGIRNPAVHESDIVKLSMSKSMHEDVIRYICNNGDWTKSYTVKLNLVQNPKTPTSLVMRWLPLIRQTDLKLLSRSKQIPQSVAVQAKRMLENRGQ